MPVKFRSPAACEPDDLEPWLKDKIFSEGEQFWNSRYDTGIASLEFLDGSSGAGPQLIFTKKDQEGFHLLYRPRTVPGGPPIEFIAKSNDDFSRVVEVHCCDEPLRLCPALFVPEKTAWLIVQRFLKDGVKEDAAGVEWVPTHQLGWCVVDGVCR